MKTILITGFEPFGGETVNPAWEAARALHVCNYKQQEYQIEIRQLPTVFDKSLEKLYQFIEETNADIVICLGQAGGRSTFSLERVAINMNDARIPDNEYNQPIDTPVVTGGPVGYWTTLPIKAIVQRLEDESIPVSISHTAGTFVCNHVFYGLMNYIATKKPGIKGGFIHTPYLPEQTINIPDQPSMSLEIIVQALMSTIDITATVTTDISAVGGQIS